jgi:imidazolonepropionase-like amidohydrolase
MKKVLLAAVAAVALAGPAAAASVVTADRYLDVNTGRYVEQPAIFIDDAGRITSIGDARTVRWASNVRHINLTGQTLLPGLIDMHVHLDGPADIGGYRGLEFTDSFWAMTAVANGQAMLGAGFTIATRPSCRRACKRTTKRRVSAIRLTSFAIRCGVSASSAPR